MKFRRSIIVAAMLLLIVPAAGQVVFGQDAERPGFLETLDRGEELILRGPSTNVTVNASDTVSFSIKKIGEDRYVTSGRFGGQSLFGGFSLPGRCLNGCFEKDYRCLQFTGELVLGNDGSGFPSNTRTSFVLSLVVKPDQIAGVYRVGELMDRDYEQYGAIGVK